MASYTVTRAPPPTSTSAAISPAGPPPMTAMWGELLSTDAMIAAIRECKSAT